MRGGRIVAALAALAGLTAGCSSSKYTAQIEEQKAQIMQLQQQNAQLQTDLAQSQGTTQELMTELQRSRMAATTAKVSAPRPAAAFSGGDASKFRALGVTVFESESGMRMTLPGASLFASGSTALTKDGKAQVAKVAAAIKAQFPDRRIRIDGYTDNVPPKKTAKLYPTNKDLSLARAKSVANYMIETLHFNADQVSTEGFGEAKPIGDNGTAAGRAKNRRVEITILN